MFVLKYQFSGNGFLGVCGVWVKTNSTCVVMNIYSSCSLSIKKEMWRVHVMSKLSLGGKLWCLVGDFNAI